MRIGLSYWGVCYDFSNHRLSRVDTPDGHRYGRPILITELLQRGHDVIEMQFGRAEFGRYSAFCGTEKREVSSAFTHGLPDLDVLFLEWRWPTWKNDRTHPKHDPQKHEPDLDRQLELIEYYKDRCPIIVWDTDLKVTPEDEARWPELILTDPSLKTNRLTRSRVSLPFWTDWMELLPPVDPYPIYGYIGNNYERPDEFQKYYFQVAEDTRLMGVQTTMYGNWLQTSPERESPSYLISSNRQVAFNHRMNFYDSMCMMNRFICTTHVSKPRYYETGFMSPRYLEAMAVGCPALTPASFNGGPLLGEKYVVSSPAEVRDAVRWLKDLSFNDRAAVVAEQRGNLLGHGMFSVTRVADFIESGGTSEDVVG